MKRFVKRILITLPLLCLQVAMVLSLAIPLRADDIKAGNASDSLIELSNQLNDTDRDLADEYLTILGNLDATIEDYTEYIDELDGNFLLEKNLSFRLFDRKLQSANYLKDPRELQDDIQTFLSRLDRLTDHQHSGDCTESCRLLTNFRRELSVIDEHVNDYLSTRTRRRLREKGMVDYLRASLSRMIEERSDAPRPHSSPLDNADRHNSSTGATVETKLNTSDPTPDPSTVPEPDTEPLSAEHAHSARTFFDSLYSALGDREIEVINPAGDLRVTGWNKPMISVTLEVEVASQGKSSENAFLDNTSLIIDTLGGTYKVSVSFPPLDNIKTRLTKSALVIRIPSQYRLSASNSFGQISVADINADVTIQGHHSEINADNILGATDVVNSSGTIRLTDIKGELFTKCSYGAIELTNCRGEIQVENTYSDIRMYDCGGSAALRGSGNVFVQGFVGPLDISNSYGPVEVRDVDGALEATNAYNALIVRNISGNATLENSYANITAYKIGGYLNVSNSNGLIIVEGMEGPVNIENEKGDIKIVLDRSMGGNSTITNDGGEIDVAFQRRGDFVLSASTVFGKINSHLPLYIKKDGDNKSTAITFGRGLDSVLLVGTNTVINITENN